LFDDTETLYIFVVHAINFNHRLALATSLWQYCSSLGKKSQ